jgi:hypothetical protein
MRPVLRMSDPDGVGDVLGRLSEKLDFCVSRSVVCGVEALWGGGSRVMGGCVGVMRLFQHKFFDYQWYLLETVARFVRSLEPEERNASRTLWRVASIDCTATD